MDRFYSDRSENILEALKFAAYHVQRGPRAPNVPVDVTVINNKVCYSDGASVYRVTFESRNFMDERREAMEKQP